LKQNLVQMCIKFVYCVMLFYVVVMVRCQIFHFDSMYSQKIAINLIRSMYPLKWWWATLCRHHKTCVTVNASDSRTAIVSPVIRPTSPASTVTPTLSLITPPAWPGHPIKAYAIIASRVIMSSATELWYNYQTLCRRAMEIIRLKTAWLVRSKTVLINS